MLLLMITKDLFLMPTLKSYILNDVLYPSSSLLGMLEAQSFTSQEGFFPLR